MDRWGEGESGEGSFFKSISFECSWVLGMLKCEQYYRSLTNPASDENERNRKW